MSRPLHLAPNQPHATGSTRADLRVTVQVDEHSQITSRRFGDRTELVVSDPQGRTVVTLELPASDFRRLVTELSKAWNGEQK